MFTTDPQNGSCCCAPRLESGILPAQPQQEIAKSSIGLRLSSKHLAGGEFLMGTDFAGGFPDDGEGPVRQVTLSPFAINVHPVTNELFAQFIKSTSYQTDAERFGWSFVFAGLIPKKRYAQLVEDTVAATPWWCKVRGAAWNHPEGPQSNLQQRNNHPVVHVSWNDAVAFCAWSGQRLPSEAEWEYAARGGLEQKLYAWGDTLRVDSKHMCNIWQGTFPDSDTGEDGFKGTCPVEAFTPNGYGLWSMTGNVWEWCNDWFSTDFHRMGPRANPSGPASGQGKVMKGGSFLCHGSYCNRYRVAARTMNSIDSSSSNIGFRCAS